ncbi:MAG: FkbM family methyltransferase [Planctomycetota bacterium]
MTIRLCKRLPTSFERRRVLVSPRAYRRYWLRSLSNIHDDILSAVLDWVLPGAVVWDVGANCGVFTCAAAVTAGDRGKVFAFEADIQCADLIDRSRRLGSLGEAQITVCPMAISDVNSTVTFEISSYRSAASSLEGFGRFEATGSPCQVLSFRLDTLRQSIEPPSVLKIDVEGAEHLVLRGAKELLQRDRPILICECSGGDVAVEINQILRDVEYHWRPMDAERDVEFTQNGITCSDIVAIPRENDRAPSLLSRAI